MKKVILLTVVCVLGFGFNSDACEYLKGSANLVDNGNGTSTLTCPGTGECAKLNCDGERIDIYIGDDVIKAIRLSTFEPVDNGDGTFSLPNPVTVEVVQE